VPQDVPKNTKIKTGEIFGKESKRGIVFGESKDKRNVTLISTKYGLAMTDTDKENRTRVNVIEASAILFYNRHKKDTDISDQMSSSLIVLRRTIRWYYSVAFEVLFGTAVVNAQNLSI
jgi:hypothetical protein